MVTKKTVAVVGATGIAGQQFMTALAEHPWFEVVALAGSERSAGKRYLEALRAPSGQVQWWQSSPLADKFKNLPVELASDFNPEKVDIVFTAVDSSAAKLLEPVYAKKRPTISTASAFRMEADVPLLVPGVNTDHHKMIQRQKKQRGWQGFVVPIPNCTTYGMVCTLAPLYQHVGIKYAVMTSMQATSGAGRNGGVLALDVIDNLIPFISGEEEKVEIETQKILGKCNDGVVSPASFGVSATCTRVPVTDGHTEAVFVATERSLGVDEAKALFREFDAGLSGLPSAPRQFLTVHDDPFHPQPRLDRDADGGMTTHIGRIRQDKTLSGIKYVLLSHNTQAGAAKGAIMVAELLCRDGLI